MKTLTQLSRCCWVRKTNLRVTKQSEKFHVRRGSIDRSRIRPIEHLLLKCCKKMRAQQLTKEHSVHALFSVCSLRDDNVIKSKSTWKMKHVNSILESFEYFCQISSKSIHIISSYIVSNFKVGSFLRHSVVARIQTRTIFVSSFSQPELTFRCRRKPISD